MRPGAGVRLYGTISVVLAFGTALLRSAEPAATNAPGDQMLMTDDFGKLVVVPTNALPSQFFPPPGRILMVARYVGSGRPRKRPV